MKEQDNQSLLLRVLFYLLVAVILVFNLFPFLYALLSSFRPSNDLFSTDLWPKALGLDHYQAVFKDARFVGSLINSVIVAGSHRINLARAREHMRLCARPSSFSIQGAGALPSPHDDDVSVDLGAVWVVRDAEGLEPLQYASRAGRDLSDFYDAVHDLGDDSVFPQPPERARGSRLR